MITTTLRRRPGLPRLLSELRRYGSLAVSCSSQINLSLAVSFNHVLCHHRQTTTGMDVLSPPALHDSVLNIIFRFFKEETERLTHREITYRLFYRLIGMGQTIPGIADVSRTKVSG